MQRLSCQRVITTDRDAARYSLLAKLKNLNAPPRSRIRPNSDSATVSPVAATYRTVQYPQMVFLPSERGVHPWSTYRVGWPPHGAGELLRRDGQPEHDQRVRWLLGRKREQRRRDATVDSRGGQALNQVHRRAQALAQECDEILSHLRRQAPPARRAGGFHRLSPFFMHG